MTRIDPILPSLPQTPAPAGGAGFEAALQGAAARAVGSPAATDGAPPARDAGSLSDRDALATTRSLQAESASLNAQYLQLQEALQRENREFTALSNVMKVKHDTARATIGNIH